jgi:AcrR family transcriptional regulator
VTDRDERDGGGEHLRIGDGAAESDTAKTTLYSHFDSKDELVAAYLRRRTERRRTYLTAELAAHGGSATERILFVYDLLGRWFADPRLPGLSVRQRLRRVCRRPPRRARRP